MPLDDDPHIAVDVAAAEQAGLWDGELAASPDAVDVGGGVVLLPGAEISTGLRARLAQAGASQPAYRSGDQIVVVLPEVRVEINDATTAAAVRSAVRDWDVVVEQPKPGRMVLIPTSGRGVDALALANHVAETVGPPAAQARLVRVTPDPTPAPTTKEDPP